MKNNEDENKRTENPLVYIILTICITGLAIIALYIAVAGSIDAILYIFGNGISGFFMFWLMKYKYILIASVVLSLIILLLFRIFGFISDEDFKH
jgi:hypothetical protein